MMPFGFDDYFFQEEFIHPEEGGVTGTVAVTCPYCSSRWEIEPEPGNSQDCRQCGDCQQVFVIDWPNRQVSKGASLVDIYQQAQMEKYLSLHCSNCSQRCRKSSLGALRGTARCPRCGFNYEVIADTEDVEPGNDVAFFVSPNIRSEDDVDSAFSVLIEFFDLVGTSRRDRKTLLAAMTDELKSKGGIAMRNRWVQLINTQFPRRR